MKWEGNSINLVNENNYMTSTETYTVRKHTVANTDSPQYKHTHTKRETLKNILLDLKDYPSVMMFTVHLFMAIVDQNNSEMQNSIAVAESSVCVLWYWKPRSTIQMQKYYHLEKERQSIRHWSGNVLLRGWRRILQ